MRRNVILSVVAVLALTIAGIGGVFAGYSDSEISYDNYISTGSLDLKVNGADDEPWGTGVPTTVMLKDIMPCKDYGPIEIEVCNMGQALDPEGDPEPAYLYIHFKEFCCSNVEPTHEHGGYEAPDGSGLKPEPELVAEYGGLVDQVWVDGKGVMGDDCTLADHIDVVITWDGVPIGPPVKLNTILCEQIYVGELPPCGEPHIVDLIFHLQQIEDPDWNGPEKFRYWPTNALMKDAVAFGIEFDLLQEEDLVS